MQKWYLFLDNLAVGPYSTEEIAKLSEKSKISGATMVQSAAEGSSWIPLCQVPELTELLKRKSGEELLPKVMGILDPVKQKIKFSCPQCQQHYAIPEVSSKGSKVSCQMCGTKFRVFPPEEKVKAQKTVSLQLERNPAVNFKKDPIEGDIMCPHCWKTFSAGDILYIARHVDLVGDPIAGEGAMKRFSPIAYNSAGLPLDEEGMPCTDMACPHCHLQIPSSILDLSSFYVSIVGAPSSGKTYFLTSLVNELRNNFPDCLDCAFSDVDPKINAVLDKYEKMMFMPEDAGKVVVLEKTQQIGTDFTDSIMIDNLNFNLPKPFIYQMTAINAADNKKANRNIVFYDNAGELFEAGNDELLTPGTLHLLHSNAIFFIFDPLNDPKMRSLCDHNDPQLSSSAKVSNQTILFSEMVNRIRKHKNMTADEKMKTPLVIAVGKYDAWEKAFTEDQHKKIRGLNPFELDHESMTYRFNMNRVYDISFAVREFLCKYVPALVAQAEAFFEDVIFIPFSSFGTLAAKDSAAGADDPFNAASGIIPAQMDPVWVGVPFYSVFCKQGFLQETSGSALPGYRMLDAKFIRNKLMFEHPVTGKRVSLPLAYAGRCIEINGQTYRFPEKTVSRKTGISVSEKEPDSIW